VADLPFAPVRPELSDRLIAAIDADGKIQRAIAALGCVVGADVVVLGDAPARVAELQEVGARVEVLSLPDEPRPVPDDGLASLLGTLPAASIDVLVGLWTTFVGASPASLAAADRALRAGGRLLVLQDYGRDDLDDLRGAERTAELVGWSRRDGWYLKAGFKIHVVHTFWRASDAAEAAQLLEAAFGSAGGSAAASLRRERVAHNVAIYHRTRAPA
jgi:hypothetical protein